MEHLPVDVREMLLGLIADGMEPKEIAFMMQLDMSVVQEAIDAQAKSSQE